MSNTTMSNKRVRFEEEGEEILEEEPDFKRLCTQEEPQQPQQVALVYSTFFCCFFATLFLLFFCFLVSTLHVFVFLSFSFLFFILLFSCFSSSEDGDSIGPSSVLCACGVTFA